MPSPVSIRSFVHLLVALGLLAPLAHALPPGGLVTGEDGQAVDFRKVINRAKDKVFPAVIFIKCVKESHDGGRRATQEVVGSGVIISDQGEALTNWHVVDRATEVRCLLFDGRAVEADVIGTDKDTDIALLRFRQTDAADPYPAAALGDSSLLTEGDFVMAMGAPWGLSRSVSIGIVSCTRRYLPETSEYSLWLQTDASISPGNSGGPLVNTEGQVIGINARGTMGGGDLGFAIPSETIIELLPQLREVGQVKWTWTGIQLQPLRDFGRNMYFEGSEGVMVSYAEPESPGRSAGLQPRDRIVRINGQSVNGVTDEDLPGVRRTLGLLPTSQPTSIEIFRGDEPVTLALTPREKGKTQGDELDCPRWDFAVRSINQFDNPDLFFIREKGVYVHGIRSPGNALSSGLQQQDIVVKINGKKVETLDDVKAIHQQAIAGVRSNHRAILSVLRNGQFRQIALDFSRDYSKD